MPDTKQTTCPCLEAEPADVDVCACGHHRSTHPRGQGRCRADDSYGARCTCDEYGSDLLTTDRNPLDRPDHWECPHGHPTDGTHGHCDACDDLGVSDPR
jgi:hypothetical protein